MSEQISAPVSIQVNKIIAPISVPSFTIGLDGKSAYESYLDTTEDDPPLSEAEWSANDVVRHSVQVLTDPQMAQARTNIQAAPSSGIPQSSVSGLVTALSDIASELVDRVEIGGISSGSMISISGSGFSVDPYVISIDSNYTSYGGFGDADSGKLAVFSVNGELVAKRFEMIWPEDETYSMHSVEHTPFFFWRTVGTGAYIGASFRMVYPEHSSPTDDYTVTFPSGTYTIAKAEDIPTDPEDIGAATAAQGALADTAFQPIDGALQVEDGSVSKPSISFENDPDTGWYSGGANILKAATGGVDRITIGSDGKVGIGDAPSTGAHVLNVGGGFKVGTTGVEWFSISSGTVVFNSQGGTCNIGAGTASFGARINIAPISDSTPLLSMRGSATQDILRISSPASIAGDYVIVKADGKVGVNTPTPAYVFDVKGPATDNSTIARFYGNIATIGSFGIASRTAASPGMRIGTIGGGEVLGLMTVGVERVTILADGKVGIGTITPAARAHIQSTTEQVRVGYDATNYVSATVGSTGGITFSNAGAATDVWTYNGNAVFNGTANRMPNQVAATSDAVMTRQLCATQGVFETLLSTGGMTLLVTGAAGTGATDYKGMAWFALNSLTADKWVKSIWGYTNPSAASSGIAAAFSTPHEIFGTLTFRSLANAGFRVLCWDAYPATPKNMTEAAFTAKGVGIEFYEDGGNVVVRIIRHDGTSYLTSGTPFIVHSTSVGFGKLILFRLVGTGTGQWDLYLRSFSEPDLATYPVLPLVQTITDGPTGTAIYPTVGNALSAVMVSRDGITAYGSAVSGCAKQITYRKLY